MIRNAARRILRPVADQLPHRRRRRARNAARGIRPDVPLPFDMFEEVQSARDLKKAAKLAGIYHKGQSKIWDGKSVLPELIDKHGGIHLPPEKAEAIRALFAVILWGELAAWKISADLALQLEPLEAKLAATSQAHDEARHFYTMYDYLSELGEVPTHLGPHTQRLLEGVLQADTLTKKLVGMQMMIEPMAITLFQLVREQRVEPVLCDLLTLYERDEARHVALGVLHLPKLLTDMGRRETVDLWAWEFIEYWEQVEMLREMAPHFEALGIPIRRVVDLGRQKQVRANRMMFEELGYDLKLFEAYMRLLDARCSWLFPEHSDPEDRRGRATEAWSKLVAEREIVPEALSNVAA